MKQAKPRLTFIPAQLGRQRGASLLEGIAYLGIAALVVLGAVSLLTNAFGSAKGNQTTEEVVALRTAARKLYSGQVYPAAMVPHLIQANAIPNTLTRGANSTLNNGWGGGVTVVGDNAGTFTITYTNVPQDVCMSVISGANGWNSVGNGTTSVSALPATTANAATMCSATGNANTLVFVGT